MPPKRAAETVPHPKWWEWARREHELTAETILVLFALCDLSDEEGISQQSAAKVADYCGVARSTTQKAIDRLVEIHAVVDLGRENRRHPSKLRVSPIAPPTAAQVRMLATKATRRAVNDKGAWLVSVE